jgi:hypothetical protein
MKCGVSTWSRFGNVVDPVRTALVLVGCFALWACTSEEIGHAPVARIKADPRAIPQADEFHTDVVLDGTESSDPIDDPDGGLPLTYQWEIGGDAVQVSAGTMTSPMFTARFQGIRPATIRLTVTDPSGQTGTARFQLGLTVTP